MKRLIPFLFIMAMIISCSPEEIDVAKPSFSEEVKTASVILDNVPDDVEGDSVYIFTLDNSGEFYSAIAGSANEENVIKTAVPPGNASFTIIAYIPTVKNWTIEDAFDAGWYSAVVGAKNRTGRYIANEWDEANSYDNSNQSGASAVLTVDLFVNGFTTNRDYDKGDILYLEADVDNNTLSNVTSVLFSIDGTTIQDLTEEPYELNFNTIDLTAGVHTIAVSTTNEAGDEATDQVEFTVLIAQNEAPYINISGISNGASYVRQSVRTINSNASDPEGDLEKVEFKINGSLVATVDEAPYSYEWDTYDNQVGLVTVEVIAYDLEGAKRSDFVNVTLTAPENYSPRVTITAPNAGNSITAGSVINITTTVSDDEGDAIGAVYFYFDNSYIGLDNTDPYAFENFDTTGYPAGEYEIFVRVYNEAFTASTYDVITITITE